MTGGGEGGDGGDVSDRVDEDERGRQPKKEEEKMSSWQDEQTSNEQQGKILDG